MESRGDPGATHAFWGDVTATIQEMVDSGFHTVEMGMYKLSGFLVVSKAMFELGPRWLDRYVRAVILEVIADELENVIVKGTGVKQPIGMIKNLESSLHPTNGYEDKEAIVLADFSPKTIGKQILAPTTKNGTQPEHIAKWFAEQARHYKIKLITADMCPGINIDISCHLFSV